MIVVTGGAGFIGSNLIAGLNQRGLDDIIVCDWLGSGDKWRNLAKRTVADIIPPEQLPGFLDHHNGSGGRWGQVSTVFHLGANSSTTATDTDAVLAQNFAYSLDLWKLCTEHGLRLIYASSAATYGDGQNGFDDDNDDDALAKLRPLNRYGWSKHLFDRRALRLAGGAATRPAQWAGLKFFNVYGPNEYHKGDMQSVVAQKYPLAASDRPITLFRSHDPDYPDGGQMRDFIHVDDCVAIMLWLYDHAAINGLFNVGTGTARSFADLAKAIFAAINKTPTIEFIDTPEAVRAQYQYFTQANVQRLRAAGYDAPFISLEDGVAAYVRDYLATADPYR